MTTLSVRPTSSETTSAERPWVPYVAVAAGAALLLDSVLVIGSEDSLPNAPLVVLYLTGIVLALAAAVGFGLRQRRGRRALVAVGLALFVVAYVMVLSDVVAPLFELVSDEQYVNDEGPVGLLGLLLIAVGARARSNDS